MTRRKLLIGNWKMHKTVAEARGFAEQLGRQTGRLASATDYAICAPFTALHVLRVTLPSRVALGAQNLHYEPHGAFTGEISAEMLAELGVQYVIVGHSERRTLFAEPDDWIRRKVRTATSAGMTPVLCVGESLEERNRGDTFAVVERQTLVGLADLTQEETAGMVIAYEPVWAIGSGLTPTPDEAQAVIAHIRDVVRSEKGAWAADEVRILYGGSVKPENIAAFTAKGDIDGALVGGASLEAESFVRMAEEIAGGIPG